MLASKIPSSASAYMNPTIATNFDYNGNLTEFHYILEDYVNLQEKLDLLEFASLQLEKQERLTEQVKEKLDNTYDRLTQISNKKKKEAAKLEQLKHLSLRSFFSKIKGTRSSELVKTEKLYQNTCKQYDQAKKAFDVNKSLWDESKKELLECQTNNKNYNRYKNELEELLQEVFDGPTPNFPQEDALEQQVMKLFLNFTQLSQVIHQCELAKDDLRNAHMNLVSFFRGGQTVREYASVWDLPSTSVIKIIKENEKHDELTIISDAKDYVKLANEKIQHARVLLTKKTNLSSNKIERLEELVESIVDSYEFKNRESGMKRIDSNLEKELGETRIWLGEEIQSLNRDYNKQEKELAVSKTKLFEERQRILNLWVVNIDDSTKKQMIQNSSARGRKRTKNKILKSLSQEDENNSNWFDNSGITCAADLAIRNNTLSRNTSVKSSATLLNDSLNVGSCPASNGFYSLSNLNQYIGSTPSLEYYRDPMFNSLPRWHGNQQNNSFYTIPDNLNTTGMDFYAPSFKAQSEIIKNDVRFSDSQSQGGNSVIQSNKKSSESQSNNDNSKNSNSNNNSNSKRNLKRSNTYTSKRSIPTRSGTRNSRTTASAINVNGTYSTSLDYSMGNALNNSFVSYSSTPNSLGMMNGYSQNIIPRIHPNGSNYMYNQYSLQATYLSQPQYYSYNGSTNDINANTTMFNTYALSNSYSSNPISTSITVGNMSVPTMSPLNNVSSILSKNETDHNGNSKVTSSSNNDSTIQRSRSAIVSHVMDKPLNRSVVNETINFHLPSSSSKSTHTNNGGSTPNISQLQQSPMFPFPQRSRSVSIVNIKPKEERKFTSPFSFHRKIRSNTVSVAKYDLSKIKMNKEENSSISKIQTVSIENKLSENSINLIKKDEDEKSINIINDNSEDEENENENNDDSSSSSSDNDSSTSSSSDDEDDEDNDSESIDTTDEEEEDDDDIVNENEKVNEKEDIQEVNQLLIDENEIIKPVITDRKDSKNINIKSLYENSDLLKVDKLMAISSSPTIQ